MKLNKSQVSTLIIGVVLLISYFILVQSKVLQAVNWTVFDWQSQQLAPSLPIDNDILVIAIDDYSLSQLSPIAGRWPWPRTVHGQLISGLTQIGSQSLEQKSLQQDFAVLTQAPPKSIAFDILFAEADIYRPDADSYFNEVLSETDNVYFATLALRTQLGGGKLMTEYPSTLGLRKTNAAVESARAAFILPKAIDEKYWKLGSINFRASVDGIGRYYDVHNNISGWEIPSLPSKLASNINVALPNTAQILLQWQGEKEQPYPTLSYVDVYQAVLENDEQYLQQLSNKIVLIGATASGLFDARATPLNTHLPGVYMLATALDNLKNKRYLTPINTFYTTTIFICAIALLTACFLFNSKYSYRVVYSGLFVVIFSAGLVFISNDLLESQQVLFIGTLILWLMFCFLVFSFYYGYLEYRKRQQAQAMFSRFLHPEMVTSLLKEGGLSPEQLNKKQVVTVLFSDIRSFTTMAEQNDTQQIVELLNNYFNQQVSIIFNHKGTLDKFIGDCIMAFWGAPLESDDHAVEAITAALEMEAQLYLFQKTLPAHLQYFDIGIGIHTGECLVGMIGADLRLDYTVIGDTVNLASRIEGLTKNRTRILVSEQTKLKAEHAFDFIFYGEHQVKGRAGFVKLYQPTKRTI
jgi:adenylate cyclase